MSAAEVRTRRDAWAGEWKKRTTAYWSQWLWPLGYAELTNEEFQHGIGDAGRLATAARYKQPSPFPAAS